MLNTTNSQLKEQHAELLATGKAIIFAVTPSEKKAGAFDYHFAQQRKTAIANADIAAVAMLRSNEFGDQIYRAWVSSVSADSHAANIDKGMISVDENGDFVPSVVEGLHVVIRETTDATSVAYLNSEGDANIAKSRFKRVRGNVALKDGNPIFRSSTVSTEQTDTLVSATSFVDTADDDTFAEYVTDFVSNRADELKQALLEKEAAKANT